MSVIRLWIVLDTRDLTPAQTRAEFIQAIRDAVTTAELQGRLEHVVAVQLRQALQRREAE